MVSFPLCQVREPNGSYTYAVWSTSTGTSTKLVFNAPVAGTLNIQGGQRSDRHYQRFIQGR